ncbi:MAG: hypothetical protein WBA45_11070 [Microthrixaceae bacterium]
MSWTRTSTAEILPEDPAADMVAEAISEILLGATVEILYSPIGMEGESLQLAEPTASATGEGPPGWLMEIRLQLSPKLASLSGSDGSLLRELLDSLPESGLRAAAEFRPAVRSNSIGPAFRRAIRDTVVSEALTSLLSVRFHHPVRRDLIDETFDFLIELGGIRVESQDLTHGVVITDGIKDEPRLRFSYPSDIRDAKRAPLLFDGLRSILVVDSKGRARTEFQRARPDRLQSSDQADGDSLAAEATLHLGGLALMLESDRTIRAFIDGQPLLVRRGEHWTAFPLELGKAITKMVGGGNAAQLIVQAALRISSERHGAILAIVSGPKSLDGIVPLKDRYDLRNEIDLDAMQPETRLHHLIDAVDLDVDTLTRIASLDGATIMDRDANLLAYGAVVASSDSRNEGARTAAAKTLSHNADVVLKVSVDGDITIFRAGAALTTLLGRTGNT